MRLVVDFFATFILLRLLFLYFFRLRLQLRFNFNTMAFNFINSDDV